MTLFQALLLATSLGWTIVTATLPREAAPPAVEFPQGPKYGNNITSIAGTGTGTGLNVPCPTCPTYNSPRVESTQASLNGPGKPTEPSGPKITEPPATTPLHISPDEPPEMYPSLLHAETTPAASTLPRIPGIEQTAQTLDVPSPTGDSHERPNPKDSPLTSRALIAGTKTLTGSALLSHLAAPASPIGPSHAILPGSPSIVFSGTTYSAATTGPELYANGAVVRTTLPLPTGDEQKLGEATLSALGIGITAIESASSMITSTTASGGNAERTGSGTATESEAPLQTGSAPSDSKSRMLVGSAAGIGLLGLMMALL